MQIILQMHKKYKWNKDFKCLDYPCGHCSFYHITCTPSLRSSHIINITNEIQIKLQIHKKYKWKLRRPGTWISSSKGWKRHIGWTQKWKYPPCYLGRKHCTKRRCCSMNLHYMTRFLAKSTWPASNMDCNRALLQPTFLQSVCRFFARL